jgi:excisionase family DNA binding protein
MERAYWTIKELSTYSGIAVGTLYNWVSQRKIPYSKINGNVRFHIENTKKFFDSKTVKPRKPIQ